MTPSVQEINLVLVQRTGKYLTAAGLAGGASELVDPVRWALSMLGNEPGSLVEITNDDLVAVTGLYVDALLDLAELRLLETVLGNMTAVTVKAGPVTQNLSDLGKQLLTVIAAKRAAIAKRYGSLLVLPLDETSPKPVTLWAM